jgi:aspartate racemase
MNGLIGVLGGMGPLATADFVKKVIEQTPASCDQEHVPLLVYSVPQIPDRQRALAGTGESPVPAMLEGLHILKQAGAEHVAIPCNTAHCWHAELLQRSGLDILHIADAVAESLATACEERGKVGLLATQGTLQAGFFQQRLARHGSQCLTNTGREFADSFTPGVYAVKRGQLREGGTLLEQAAQRLVDRGAQHLVLACTEVAPALEAIASPLLATAVDATRALAAACVRRWLAYRSARAGT